MSKTEQILKKLYYPLAAMERVPISRINDLLAMANAEVGDNVPDAASLAYGYWHGVKDERTRANREIMKEKLTQNISSTNNTRDPVAALKLAMKAALPGAFLYADDLALGSEAAARVLAEQGYVLVNAEGLDRVDQHLAILEGRALDGWKDDPKWDVNEIRAARAIFAAIQEQER